MPDSTLTLHREKWDEVRNDIKAIDLSLDGVFEILCAIAEDLGENDAFVYSASLSYGDLYINDGTLVGIETNNQPGARSVFEIGTGFDVKGKGDPDELKAQAFDELTDNGKIPIPLGLVLDNSVEVFQLENDPPQTPLAVLNAGEFLGVFETLDWLVDPETVTTPAWNISSGARSVFFTTTFKGHQNFMKPPISRSDKMNWLHGLGRKSSHGVVDEFVNLFGAVDRTEGVFAHIINMLIEDHYLLVKLLAHEATWRSRVIFFPKQWYRYEQFHALLLRTGWLQSSYLRLYPSYLRQLHRHRSDVADYYRVRPALIYLMAVGNGELPCFRPAQLGVHSDLGPFDDEAVVTGVTTLKSSQSSERSRPFANNNNDFDDVCVMVPFHLSNAGDQGYVSMEKPTFAEKALFQQKPAIERTKQLRDFFINRKRYGDGSMLSAFNLSDFRFYKDRLNTELRNSDGFADLCHSRVFEESESLFRCLNGSFTGCFATFRRKA